MRYLQSLLTADILIWPPNVVLIKASLFIYTDTIYILSAFEHFPDSHIEQYMIFRLGLTI